MDLYSTIDTLSAAQLKEVSTYVFARFNHVKNGAPPPARPGAVPMVPAVAPYKPPAAPLGRFDHYAKFMVGDMIEFYSTKHYKNIRAIVERVNGKSLSCREVENRFSKLRVAPTLARLVGADKPASAPVAPGVPAIPSAMPTAAGAGTW